MKRKSYLVYNTSPNGVEIRADHVAVRGLTVQGFGFGDDANGLASAISIGYYSDDGRTIYSAGDIEISGDTFRHNYEGIAINGFAGNNPVYAPGGAYLKGYRLLGNLITDNSSGGGSLSGASVLVAGNKFLGNGGGGVDVTGIGVTVSGNESGNNGGGGMSITDAAGTYDPSANDPKNPAPTLTTFNYIHDNGGYGIQVQGTQAVLGNAVTNSTGHGINLDYADYSTISGNVISGTTLAGYTDDAGTGIYAEYGGGYNGEDSGLKISLNQISGNAGDGIYFFEVAGGVISLNNVTGNQGIGIHLSDYTFDYGYNDYAPTTVTRNRALHNTVLDARDDAAAPAGITYGGEDYYGDGAPLFNIWTKNLFGTTDPAGLGK